MRAIKTLGFNPKKENGGNPILAFILQEYVQARLLRTKLLNSVTYKAIHNSISNRLIAHSEFFPANPVNSYNIIYCPDLYRKSAVEMSKYIKLQSEILIPSASAYTMETKNNNRKVFLYTGKVSEPNLKKRVDAINQYVTKAIDDTQKLPVEMQSMRKGTLNSYELAELLRGKTTTKKVHLDTAGQDKIIAQLKGKPARIFATLMSLSLSTGNKTARNALNDDRFKGLPSDKIIEATIWLAANNVITKGQLQDDDAESLATKLVAALATI
jgi:hypothetical protein